MLEEEQEGHGQGEWRRDTGRAVVVVAVVAVVVVVAIVVVSAVQPLRLAPRARGRGG